MMRHEAGYVAIAQTLGLAKDKGRMKLEFKCIGTVAETLNLPLQISMGQACRCREILSTVSVMGAMTCHELG